MPITVTFGNDVLYSKLMDWLTRLEKDTYVYIFPFREVTFFYKEDAVAFMFAFNGQQKFTKIELMIKAAGD
jgi:hypothetical protein